MLRFTAVHLVLGVCLLAGLTFAQEFQFDSSISRRVLKAISTARFPSPNCSTTTWNSRVIVGESICAIILRDRRLQGQIHRPGLSWSGEGRKI